MTDRSLLTLIVPVSLEEVLVDWLLENAPEHGFCSFPVNGHSASHRGLTVAEQVSGRKRQMRFEVHAPDAEAQSLVEGLKQQFPGVGMHYWLTPLRDAGQV